MGISNIFWNAIGALQGKPRMKLRVEFNEEIKTEAKIKEALHGYNVIKTDHKGVFSWRVDIRTSKESADVIEGLSKRKIIRSVEVID